MTHAPQTDSRMIKPVTARDPPVEVSARPLVDDVARENWSDVYSGLGISLCCHRLFSHRSVSVPK